MMSSWHDLLDLLPFAWVQYDFMKNALAAVLLMAPAFALLGSLIIQNQLSFFSEAVGHAGLTGIAIGVLLGIPDPTGAMIVFAILLAVTVTWLRNFSSIPSDTAIGLVMAAVVALGVVLLSRGGGFAKYSSYLVGDILTIPPAAIGRLFLMLVVILLLWAGFFNRFLLVSMNHSLARSRGVSIWLTELIFTATVAVVVTISIQWMGLLVINSLLILPAAASRNLARNTRTYVWGAIAFSLLSGLLGLLSSFYWNTVATGATIVLYAFALFVLTFLFRRR
jgi:zinc transport system permease protein